MPKLGKRIFWFLAISTALAFFLPRFSLIFAQVVINEFSSDTAGTTADPDWVELYNSSDSTVDLSQFRIEDYAATNKKNLSGEIATRGFRIVEWTNRLNKTGDEISLVKIQDGSLANKVGYGDKGTDVSAPGPGQSAGREIDDGEKWIIFSVMTKGSSNNAGGAATPLPTSSSTPALTSSPTPIQTPTLSSSKATYKINEVKDGDGNVLSNVKISVDGNYVHHYAPENLEFCDNCQCYEGVSCGLGSHTITLEKSGYNVWGKTITLGLDDTLEENPVMDKGSFPLPTSNPVKVNLSLAGQSGTPRENKNPTPTSSLSAKILGLGSQSSLSAKEASASELFAAPETKDAPFSTAAAGWQRNSSGLFLLLGGMSLLICSTIVWWKKRVSASSIFGSR